MIKFKAKEIRNKNDEIIVKLSVKDKNTTICELKSIINVCEKEIEQLKGRDK